MSIKNIKTKDDYSEAKELVIKTMVSLGFIKRELPDTFKELMFLLMVNKNRLPKQGRARLKGVPSSNSKAMAIRLVKWSYMVNSIESFLKPSRVRMNMDTSIQTESVKIIKNKKRRNVKSDKFLSSWEWTYLRYKILTKYGAVCMLCGATKKDDRICVDHILPRHTHPELALDADNLQVLCNTCNKGKSAKYTDDFRPFD